MKRNLFAVFLAVMLVMALVFVVAPDAKANNDVITVNDDNVTVNIDDTNKDKILDLQGKKNVTVNFTVNAELKVIDTAFMTDGVVTDMTGTTAGSLKVTCADNITGTIAAYSNYGGYYYLPVENEGTYSFHPFNMVIMQAGVHVKRNTISLEVNFIANKVVRDILMADGNEYGLYKHDDPDTETMGYYSVKKNYGFGAKYGVKAYCDLDGSLSEELVTETRTFSAYVKIGGKYIEASQAVAISPSIILYEGINAKYPGYTGTSKELALDLYHGYYQYENSHLHSYLPNLATTTAYYQKVTNESDLTSGKYILVSGSGYAPTYYDNGWVLVENPAIDGETISNPGNAIFTLTFDGANVTLTDSKGQSIAPSGGNNNGIKAGEYSWAYTFENGAITFNGTDSDTVILACNSSSSNKIRAYKATTVTSNTSSYPSAFTLYKEVSAPGCSHYPAAGKEATCTDSAECKYCFEKFGEPLGHSGGTAACNKLAECETCGEEYGSYADHTGGTATCMAQATCSVCGESYGSTDANNHKDDGKDHACDYGCTVYQGVHADGDDEDSLCDYCGETVDQGGADEPEYIETTQTMSIYGSTGTLSSDKTYITWTNNGITFKNTKNSSNAILTSDTNLFRAYSGSTVTITGKSISKIVITCTSSSYATAMENSISSVSDATVTVSGSVVTATFSTALDTVNFKMTAQSRLNKIEVTYMTEVAK